MHHCHQVPKHTKHKPGPSKGGREEEEFVAPLHVQESCPEVPEVQCPSSAYMLNTDIASSIFGEDAAPPSQSIGPSRSCSCSTCTSTSSPPCGAQQRLGDVSLCLGVAYFLRRGTLRGGGSCGGHGWHYQEGRKQRQQEVNRRRVDKGEFIKKARRGTMKGNKGILEAVLAVKSSEQQVSPHEKVQDV